MKFNFDSYFKDFNKDGQATACLDFHLEGPDVEFRDFILTRIMEVLNEEKEEDPEEKPPVLGFDLDHKEEPPEDT